MTCYATLNNIKCHPPLRHSVAMRFETEQLCVAFLLTLLLLQLLTDLLRFLSDALHSLDTLSLLVHRSTLKDSLHNLLGIDIGETVMSFAAVYGSYVRGMNDVGP